MTKHPKRGAFWKLLFGTVTCLGFALPVLTDRSKMAKTTCPDGFGLNYTLAMSHKCEMKQLHNGSMVQSIPKLIPFPSVIGGCHRRKSTKGIPGGHRICRIPDCGKDLCKNGWCEETMVDYNCHCSSGFQGRHCDEQVTVSTTEETTKPTTSHTTTMAERSDTTTSQNTPTSKISITDATTKPMTSPTTTMLDTTTYEETTTSTTPASQEDPTGVNYRGNLAHTINGHTCQAWTSQYPHEHDRTPANYPNAGLDDNYCRNPDFVDTAWCYTTHPEIRWEYCAVGYLEPRCQE